MIMRWMMRTILFVITCMVVSLSIMNDHIIQLHIPLGDSYDVALYHVVFCALALGIMMGSISSVLYERKKYRLLKKHSAQHQATIASLQQEVVALRVEARAVHELQRNTRLDYDTPQLIHPLSS
ncbi:MAG: hypothetical protein EAY65_00720 [Alphaproteobacteria bacterium]|nr:MAG: hypothetical protein EAY65_00720 [Alphaproteobacteria bacterium]